ncbi:replicative DNA helicase [Micromonospora craterilacus]|uniref:DNA 5'-3' helicase n=2 Tax=Micromonospora craterilacus TaxID=1655439 RepID=A0A2W2DQP1_9ACTN|nr:replicative DNA helicase [Micromonospora craterilacus]
MMLSADAVADIEPLLTADDFYRPIHGTIFDAILELSRRRAPTDPYAVADALGGQLPKVGGAPYLHTLIAAVPTAANGPYYAKIVREKSHLRQLAELSAFINHRLYGQRTGDAAALADEIRERLAKLDSSSLVDGPRPWRLVLPDVLDAMEAAATQDPADLSEVIPTGFEDLNRLLSGGWRAGQLVVVAARTGVGKSVATTGFARDAAWIYGVPSAIFSLEMADTEIGKRLLAAGADVPLTAIKQGLLTDGQRDAVNIIRHATANAPLYLDGTASMSLAEIRARARRLHRAHGLRLLVVDYLQLIETTAQRSENRQQAVAAVSRGLKLLAMELGITVIAVSQLNRGPENRADKRPTMADIRESGSIENDADVILLLHRDDYYDKESPRAGEADFIIAKQRDGGTDTVTVAAQLHLSRFADMAIL